MEVEKETEEQDLTELSESLDPLCKKIDSLSPLGFFKDIH